MKRKYKYGKYADYVLECILDVETGEPFEKPKDALEHFAKYYYLEHVKQNNQLQNLRWYSLVNDVKDYLQALPSCIHIAFEDFRILQLGVEWGDIKPGYKGNMYAIDYWIKCAAALIGLCRRFKVGLPYWSYGKITMI